MLWVDPKGGAAIVTGHLALPVQGQLDLDTLATFLHAGISAASGQQSVTPNKRVKICGGKQDGILTAVTLSKVQEEVVIGLSDRPYLAEYARRTDMTEDPAAVRAILSLCPP
jgi:cephalosporin-C deacetylase-like acetyl esterase